MALYPVVGGADVYRQVAFLDIAEASQSFNQMGIVAVLAFP